MNFRNETEMKTWVVDDFKNRNSYGRRIEDAYSVGFPDLVLIPKDCPVFFCEAKMIRGAKFFEPTPRQYVELTRLSVSKHSVPCLLGWDNDGLFYLHKYAKRAYLADCVVIEEWESMPVFFNRFYMEKV